MGDTYVINEYNVYYDENELDAQGNPIKKWHTIEHSFDTKHEPEVGDSWMYKENGKVYRRVVQWVHSNGMIYEDTEELDVEYQTFEVNPDDFFVEQKHGKYGVVNGLLEMVVPYEYDILESQPQPTSNLAKAKKDGKWGLIDCRNGKVIIPVECEAVELIEMPNPTKRLWTFSKAKKTKKRYWHFCKAGKWSFFDEKSNATLPNIDDLFRVDENGNYEIPEGTTEIYPALFKDNDFIRTIKIPETVVSIGKEAFMYCKNLEKVIIPESVKVIEESAFCSCIALQQIVIPKSVTEIKDNTFAECVSLESIHLPESIQLLGKSAFFNCNKLKTVTCSKSKTVNVLRNVEKIQECTFSKCASLESITIDVNRIGSQAFNECESLKEITFTEQVHYIDEYAFCNCKSLEEVFIPKTVEYLGRGTFIGCTNLKSASLKKEIYYESANWQQFPNWTAIHFL